MDELVSIIIPCYNGEKTIDKCLNSILNQTYKNIEIIIVNDGSTDSTLQKIMNHIPLFQLSNMKIKIINQENKGLAGAINAGLKEFTGDFLCWIDCDDFLYSNSVEIRVSFLKKNKNVAIVTSDAYLFNENDLENPIGKISDGLEDLDNPNQFLNHLYGKSIFCCGCHMIRTKNFLEVNPNRNIFPARRGQNTQMLLPLYYKYNQAFINEPLYAYIIYKNSMSMKDLTLERTMNRHKEYLDIVQSTLNTIPMKHFERLRFFMISFKKYCRNLFYAGFEYRNYQIIIKNMIVMIACGEWKKTDTLMLYNLIRSKITKRGVKL